VLDGSQHPVVHLELRTGNLPRACVFFSELLGWTPERVHTAAGAYQALDMGGMSGGVVECEERQPGWLPYVEVDEIGAATECARSLGAAVVLGPREGPAGWRSVIAAPAGANLAFWQPKERAATDGPERSTENRNRKERK
jgi:predicted enzyme related to lactoylglutathione lyase